MSLHETARPASVARQGSRARVDRHQVVADAAVQFTESLEGDVPWVSGALVLALDPAAMIIPMGC